MIVLRVNLAIAQDVAPFRRLAKSSDDIQDLIVHVPLARTSVPQKKVVLGRPCVGGATIGGVFGGCQ